MLLVPEFSDHIQHQGKYYAQKDAGRQRKIESGVFSMVNDIAGQSSDRQIGAPQQNEDESQYHQNHAEENQYFSETSH